MFDEDNLICYYCDNDSYKYCVQKENNTQARVSFVK